MFVFSWRRFYQTVAGCRASELFPERCSENSSGYRVIFDVLPSKKACPWSPDLISPKTPARKKDLLRGGDLCRIPSQSPIDSARLPNQFCCMCQEYYSPADGRCAVRKVENGSTPEKRKRPIGGRSQGRIAN